MHTVCFPSTSVPLWKCHQLFSLMPPQIQGIVILYQQDLLNILGDDRRLENVGIFILPPYKARDQVEKTVYIAKISLMINTMKSFHPTEKIKKINMPYSNILTWWSWPHKWNNFDGIGTRKLFSIIFPLSGWKSNYFSSKHMRWMSVCIFSLMIYLWCFLDGLRFFNIKWNIMAISALSDVFFHDKKIFVT